MTPKLENREASTVGFDDIQVEYDGERTCSLMFVRGDEVRAFCALAFPIVIYRGDFRSEQPYAKGDAVRWGGSLWIAQKDTVGAKPGDAGWESLARRKA